MLRSDIPQSADSIETHSPDNIGIDLAPIKRRNWTATVWSGILPCYIRKAEEPCLKLNQRSELKSKGPSCISEGSLRSMQKHRSDVHYSEVSTSLL